MGTKNDRPALVTGGAGFIGSELVRQLLAEGRSVIVYDNFSFGTRENLPENARLVVVEGDLNDTAKLQETMDKHKPADIFHLAAIHFIPYCLAHPLETMDVNVKGTLSLFEASKRDYVKSVVYTSTAAVYPIKDTPHVETDRPEPMEIYGASKLFGEHLASLFHNETGIKCGVARLFNAFGPRETNPHVIPEILDQLAKGNTISLGNIDPKRDFIHTSDISSAMRAMAANNNYAFETFNVGTGSEISVKEILDTIAEISKRPLKIQSEESRKRKIERYHLVPDITKIKQKLGWQPQVTIRAGFLNLLESSGLIDASSPKG